MSPCLSELLDATTPPTPSPPRVRGASPCPRSTSRCSSPSSPPPSPSGGPATTSPGPGRLVASPEGGGGGLGGVRYCCGKIGKTNPTHLSHIFKSFIFWSHVWFPAGFRRFFSRIMEFSKRFFQHSSRYFQRKRLDIYVFKRFPCFFSMIHYCVVGPMQASMALEPIQIILPNLI